MMNFPKPEKITIDKIFLPIDQSSKMEADILRLDKIHPVISGNKFFKLKYFLDEAVQKKCEGILTFGGAWSNHIVATACMASMYQLKSIGIIRGEKPAVFSETLKESMKYGMRLEFISRESYRNKQAKEFLSDLSVKFPGYYIIPEGGADMSGVKGAEEILELVGKNDYTHISCAVGTGTTFCGIANASEEDQQLIAVPVLKIPENSEKQFTWFLNQNETRNRCHFFYKYHFGGYAKYTDELIQFMNSFYRQTNIPTDFVYTGKLLFAINDLVNKNYFSQGSKILMIHSGGLQGNRSLENGTLIF